MDNAEIARLRLHNQRLSSTTFHTAQQVVTHLGAVQSQDYAGAKWAVGQRMVEASDAALEQAFNDGCLLRTHVLRPTWHFVSPEDIRWMLKLTAPRVHAANAFAYRQSGWDTTTFKNSNRVLEKTLRDGKQLTRAELGSALDKAGITAEGVPLGYLTIYAELEGIICSGVRRGKQFTYALLDERAPQAKSLTREEALAELTRRYFMSRGPATLQDFVWWSGLSMADARKGLELVKVELRQQTIDDQTYWLGDSIPKIKDKPGTVCLLPDYDEYLVAYADRRSAFDTTHTDKLDSRGMVLAQYTMVLDGQVTGTWKRILKARQVLMEMVCFRVLGKVEKQAVTEAAEGYGKFLGLPVELKWNK